MNPLAFFSFGIISNKEPTKERISSIFENQGTVPHVVCLIVTMTCFVGPTSPSIFIEAMFSLPICYWIFAGDKEVPIITVSAALFVTFTMIYDILKLSF